MDVQPVPIYLDWTFWAFVVAAVAVVLSQLPHLHLLLRRAKLEVEPYSMAVVTHKAGNPNFSLHLIITNTGGRRVKVSKISVSIRRGRDAPIVLPAKNYFQNPDDKAAVMLTSFQLAPDEQWNHSVNFLNYFSREDNREFRQLMTDQRNDVSSKRGRPEYKDKLIPVDDALYERAIHFFDRQFMWNPGEYELTLQITATPHRASITRNFRFTLFESDTATLKAAKDGYRYGAGIYYDPEDPVIIGVDLISVQGNR